MSDDPLCVILDDFLEVEAWEAVVEILGPVALAVVGFLVVMALSRIGKRMAH